ncbi:hypothetical protein K504DRAFT_454349 [Pleomassaria siparia CBS 279.74]|uniref:Large ribosomal subunit protein mL67 n=1 Tax=Pleomassaria siparia CBS 279.74 TaxID=1314801 RepID=A0A6G1KB26_9PLEO|nr:hypothetical protein K504DRAFT_454349 [Pleomassaria siparia CBS 279.74]
MPRPPIRVRMNKIQFRPPRNRYIPQMPELKRVKKWTDGELEKRPDQIAKIQRTARLVAEHLALPDAPQNVQKLVKATWVKRPGEKITAERPYTLRDLRDPEGYYPEHGQLIFVFRNVQTNQILYSLSEVLDESHLRQIPFFAKHSAPPSLRRDVWVPHCVVSFPTPEQGHNAFRKLRELRKMHELCWDQTNPEWVRATTKTRMMKIMNQRANTSVDLAKVLSMQAEQGGWMVQNLEKREKEIREFLYGKEVAAVDKPVADPAAGETNSNKEVEADSKEAAKTAKKEKASKKREAQLAKGMWPAIEEMAELAETGELNRLAVSTRNLTWRLERIRPGKNDKLKQSLEKALLNNKNRTNRLLWARRRAFAFNKARDELEKQAFGTERRIAKAEEDRERHTIAARAARDSGDHEKKLEHWDIKARLRRDILNAQQKNPEPARIAKEKLATDDHFAAHHILPRHLLIPLPSPYVAEGVEIQWADMLDGEYAKDMWPVEVQHTTLPLTEQITQTTPMRPDEWEDAIEEDRQAVFEDWLKKYEARNEPGPKEIAEMERRRKIVEEKQKRKPKGLFQYLPVPKNLFSRARAMV